VAGDRQKLRIQLGLWLALFALAAAIAGCSNGSDAPPQVKIGSTVWDVDLALTNAQRLRGMGGKAYLDEDVGMLFVYPEPAPRSYCMRDCLISLDIAFIDSDLRIVKIYTMPAEFDRAGRVSYDSIKPAQYVLEVGAGQFARKGISQGDKVVLLGNIPSATKADPGP
jgi:uncharacterized protein